MSVELAKTQIEAIKELNNGHILAGDVGSGKSRTALGYFFLRVCHGEIPINGIGRRAEPKTPRNLVVITTAKKRDDHDWEDEAARFGIFPNHDGTHGPIRMDVDSWNNISNYVGRRDTFFIFDEQRLVGSGAWVKSFYAIAAKNDWILLSATPGDNWMDYLPVFVANGFYTNKTEFIRRHVVYKSYTKFPSIDRYTEVFHLQRLRESILVDMPVPRHTTRHIHQVPVEYDKAKFEKVLKERWHIYEDRPLKNVAELLLVLRKVVNSDLSRFGEVMKKFEKHPRLIVFYSFDYELDILRTLGTVLGVDVKEWNGHKHQSVPEGDTWIYLVQYTAGAEGWNCIQTDATLFYSLQYSYKIYYQAQGRIDRLNTEYTDLHYYVLRSGAAIDQAISKTLNDKQTFNEKAWLKEIGL